MGAIAILIYFLSMLGSIYGDCKPASNFIKHHNEALQGHVIKTIQTNRMDCTMECGEMMGCRSINIYKDGSGNDMCDLNKSTRSKSPGFMVSRDGYQHWELTARNGCSKEECLGSVDWKMFNSSLFKVFNDRVTWGEARKRCRDVGGDLVSIHSQQEQDFISTQLLTNVTRGNSTNNKQIMLWRLNGISDVLISLHGSAEYRTVDGYQALYLDGNSQNYAVTRPMFLKYSGFTLGAWVKLLTPLSEGLIYGDWSSPFQFALKIDKQGKVQFKLMFSSLNTTTVTSIKTLSPNIWTHVMVSWSGKNGEIGIYINGTVDKQEYLAMENYELVSSSNNYDIGLDRNASTSLHGYLRDLIVYNYAIDNAVQALERKGRWDKRDGVWIGLNDIQKDQTYKFSDGSTMDYSNWFDPWPLNLYKFSRCVLIPLESKVGHQWKDGTCGLEMPYICRKTLN